MRTATHDHPSNVLYSGSVTDFMRAMQLVIDQCAEEARHLLVPEIDAHPEKYEPLVGQEREQALAMDARQGEALRAYAAAAHQAAAIYQQAMREVEPQIVARLRAADSDDLHRFADALESGDYSPLAI